MITRQTILDTARAYMGVREGSEQHKYIIDTYNAEKPLPRGYAVKYTDAWCATFVSFLGIVNDAPEILRECGVGEMIKLYQAKGRYTEAARIPEPGDILFFQWSHVGIVETVEDGIITTIEGNKSDMVARRQIEVSDRATIRGYGLPAYTEIEDLTANEIINQVRSVCTEAKRKGWRYGNSTSLPPCADGFIACDRMVSRAFWELGYTDQGRGGVVNTGLAAYLQKHGWGKIKAPEYCQAGDVVFINRPGVLHVFMVTAFRSVNDIDKCDLGSQDRINRGGYFQHVRLNEWADGQFAGAWRCADAMKAPDPVDIDEGVYEIKTALDSRYALDVAGGSMKASANVWLYAYNGTAAQQFRLTKNRDKSYTITNEKSELALDVSSGSKSNGANIWQYTPNGTDAQKWVIAQDENGYIFWNKASRKCMDVTGGRARSATNVWSYQRNGSPAQRWYLKPVSVPPAAEIPEGVHYIRSAANNEYCLDITGGSKVSGANAWLWDYNGSKAQKFDFSRNPDGSYTIINVGSGMALDVLGGLSAEYTNVQQYKPNGTDAQKWILTRNANGTYSLFNKGAGKMLDIAGGKIASGTNIWTFRANGTRAQEWRID